MPANPASESLNDNYDKVAGNRYDVSDYGSADETSRGLAETHEQMSDSYWAGSADPQPGGDGFRLSELDFDEDTQE